MANTNQPFGLSPVRYMNGAAYNGQGNTYFIPSGDTSQYGVGDVVFSKGTSDANGIPAIQKASAGSVPRGVITAIYAVPPGIMAIGGGTLVAPTPPQAPGPIPGTKTAAFYVWVVDDPAVIFEAQVNNTTTITATGTIGANCTIIVANPAANSPFSGTQIDSTTFATTSSLMLKVISLPVGRPGSDFTANTKLWVKFNTHEFYGSTAGYTS